MNAISANALQEQEYLSYTIHLKCMAFHQSITLLR